MKTMQPGAKKSKDGLGYVLHQNKVKNVSHWVNNVLDGRNRNRQKDRPHEKARLVLITNCFKILSALVICTAIMSILAPASFAQGPTSQDVDRAQLLQGQTQPPFGPSVTPGGIEDGRAAASPN